MRSRIVALAAFVCVAMQAAAVLAACPGDCSGNHIVAIDELVRGVNIALGKTESGDCMAFQTDTDARVTVDELNHAVYGALYGCPYTGRFASTVILDAGRTGTLDLMVPPDGPPSGTLVITDAAAGSLASGGAAAVITVTLSGSVNLETGEFSISGSYNDGAGHTIPINVSGTLPVPFGGSGTVTFELGVSFFYGSIAPVAPNTPTPTPTTTPTPSGAIYTILVGQTNLPFDPELIEIQVGDTIEWSWVAGSHSVVSGPSGVPPPCTADGMYDSDVQSSGTFRHTFTSVGTYTYHCGVPGHCENFESGIIEVRGTPTPTPTPSPTFPPTETPTPTPDTIAGVSVAMLGVFDGRAYTQFNTDFPVRLDIRVDNDHVVVTDLVGYLLGLNTPLVMIPLTTTKIQYTNPDPFNKTTFTLELVSPSHLTGTYVHEVMFMGGSTVTLDLMKIS